VLAVAGVSPVWDAVGWVILMLLALQARFRAGTRS